MLEVTLESTRTVSPLEFRAWVAQRDHGGDPNHYQLLNGRIVMHPPAGYPHGEIGAAIQFALMALARPHKLERVFDASQGFELPSGDIVEPDHSFVSHARWNAAPPPEDGAFLRVVPDLVVEVLSPATSSRDRGEKKAI